MILLLIALLAVGVYYLLRQNGQPESKPAPHSDAEEILKQRFVTGEIDEETYHRMLKIIQE